MRLNRSEVLTLSSCDDATYSREEFIQYWSGSKDYNPIADIEENLAETLTQIRSETAMFGDAWPGAWVQYNSAKARLEFVKARLNSFRDQQ